MTGIGGTRAHWRERFEEAKRRSRVFIDGTEVDPNLVSVGDQGLGQLDIVVEIGAVIIVSELEKLSVEFEEANLVAFVRGDIERHGLKAMGAYLDFVKPPRSPGWQNWFRGLIGATVPVAPAPKWAWYATSKVSAADDGLAIRILGKCAELRSN